MGLYFLSSMNRQHISLEHSILRAGPACHQDCATLLPIYLHFFPLHSVSLLSFSLYLSTTTWMIISFYSPPSAEKPSWFSPNISKHWRNVSWSACTLKRITQPTLLVPDGGINCRNGLRGVFANGKTNKLFGERFMWTFRCGTPKYQNVYLPHGSRFNLTPVPKLNPNLLYQLPLLYI